MNKKLTDNEIKKAVKSYEEKILANGIKSLEPYPSCPIEYSRKYSTKEEAVKAWNRRAEK